jgi:hypothetical protein
MALNDIVAAVCSAIVAAEIGGLGATQVHDGERDLADRSVFKALHWDAVNQRIHGWQVTWVASPDSEYAGLDRSADTTHRLELRGYYQIDDPQQGSQSFSEVRLRAICGQVLAALRADPTFGGTALRSGLPRVRVSDRGMMAEFRLHRTIIELDVVEREAW